MPCMELFELRSKSYKNKILEETKFKISIEAGSSDCWKNICGSNGITLELINLAKVPLIKIFINILDLKVQILKILQKNL